MDFIIELIQMHLLLIYTIMAVAFLSKLLLTLLENGWHFAPIFIGLITIYNVETIKSSRRWFLMILNNFLNYTLYIFAMALIFYFITTANVSNF